MLEINFKEPTLKIFELIKKAEETKEGTEIKRLALNIPSKVLYNLLVEKSIIKSLKKDITAINSKEKAIEDELIKKSENEMEKEDIILQLTEFYASTLNIEKLDTQLEKLYEIDSSRNTQIDVLLCKFRIYIILGNSSKLIETFNKLKAFITEGADWDRKNRFKAYEGLYFLMRGDFKKASNNFYNALASYEAEELLPFECLINYFVFSSSLCYNRNDLKNKVLLNPEVLKHENCLGFIKAYYNCDYKNCFTQLILYHKMNRLDSFMAPFLDYFIKEMLIFCYRQFLYSYKTVHIDKMAEMFNVSTDYLESNLRDFVFSKRLNVRIDKISGILHVKGMKENEDVNVSVNCNRLINNIRKEFI